MFLNDVGNSVSNLSQLFVRFFDEMFIENEVYSTPNAIYLLMLFVSIHSWCVDTRAASLLVNNTSSHNLILEKKLHKTFVFRLLIDCKRYNFSFSSRMCNDTSFASLYKMIYVKKNFFFYPVFGH